jgi:hypothetical protein
MAQICIAREIELLSARWDRLATRGCLAGAQWDSLERRLESPLYPGTDKRGG